MINVIFFDAAQTLIYLPASVGENYRKIALELGVDLDAAHLDRAFRQAWKESPARVTSVQPQPDDDKNWWRALVHRVLELTLPAADSAHFPEETYFAKLYDHFAEPGVWDVFPEVYEVLTVLRSRGHRLGVISNFDRRLYAVFQHLGLTPYFERIIVSSEVGADKPDPAIFRYALDALRVAPESALHVGDDPERDGGAEAVGMTIFKLDRPQNSLRDLLAFLDEENLRRATR